MRYLIMLHGRDSKLNSSSPKQSESDAAFLARFDDALAAHSELEWSEVLAPTSRATIIHSNAERGAHAEYATITRVWMVRVADSARAGALGRELAEALGTRIEVRECLPSSQKP